MCKECSRRPKDELNRITYTNEIMGFWAQKNISKNNINRLDVLAKTSIAEVAELAQVVLEVAHSFPCRKKRINGIARERKGLIPKLEKVGLIHDWVYYEDNELFGEEYDEDEEYYYEVGDPLSEKATPQREAERTYKRTSGVSGIDVEQE